MAARGDQGIMRTVCRSHNRTFQPVGTEKKSLICGRRDETQDAR